MLYRSHRGNTFYAPENTMPAFQMALDAGFDYLETDPQCTKDGEIVLLHDNSINRTCRHGDGSRIEENLALSDLTYAELIEFDAGISKDEAFRGVKIPRLEELLQAMAGRSTILALDKKIPTEKMGLVYDLVKKYPVRVCFSCGDLARVEDVLRHIPDAMIDFDRDTSEETLSRLSAMVKRENLIVWLYLDKPNFAWLDAEAKVSPECCARVKKYARLGIANVNNPYDVLEAMTFEPDVLEV